MRRPYDSQYWRNVVRPTVLQRDNYTCQLRLSTKCKGTASLPHHIVDWKDGGSWYSLENLIASCQPCNKAAARRREAQALARERTPTPTPSRAW